MFSPERLLTALTSFLALILSLSFHEAAHAWTARRKGDRTAEAAGRLTLNPLAHIDPLGTVLLPLVGILTGAPVIGWAKPVPVDLRNVRSPRWDNLQISLAGPASNLLLSALALTLFVLLEGVLHGAFLELLKAMVLINALLAFFNLIPLPPLDGAAIATTLLPPPIAAKYEAYLSPYGFFILMVVVISGGLRWLPGVALAWVQLVGQVLGFLLGSGLDQTPAGH